MPRTGPTDQSAQQKSYEGWYVAREIIPGNPHAALPATYVDVYFQWKKNYQPTVNNVGITDVVAITGGPYPSAAAAQKAIAGDVNTTQQPGNGPGKGRSGGQATPGSSSGHFPDIPNPLAGLMAGLGHLAAVLDAAYHQITKASMWRSLGWIALGIACIALGIVWWVKTEATGFVGGVIKNAL